MIANIKDPNQLAKIMKDLDPTSGKNPLSPPVGLII